MSQSNVQRRTVLRVMASSGALLAMSPGFLLTGWDGQGKRD
ncbi:hypothetical protein [Marinobacter sediminum]